MSSFAISLADPTGLVNHVRGEMMKAPGKKSVKPTYTMIQCPFHSDNTPSGQVKHDTKWPRSIGFFKCRGCGVEMGWNQFATSQNLMPFVLPESMDVPKLNVESLEEQLLGGDDDEFVREDHTLHPLNHRTMGMLGLTEPVWRSFPFKTLVDIIGAQVIEIHYRTSSRCYVYLPVMINGNLRGYVKGQPTKPTDGKPSYLNARGQWSSTSGLLGYDSAMLLSQELGKSVVALCEGPRDALRLLQHGIPAMAILGVQTWSTSKVTTLIMSGIENIIICTDGDRAGLSAASMLYSGIYVSPKGERVQKALPLKDSFKTFHFDLRPYKKDPADEKEKIDPCDAPQEFFTDLKETICRL